MTLPRPEGKVSCCHTGVLDTCVPRAGGPPRCPGSGGLGGPALQGFKESHLQMRTSGLREGWPIALCPQDTPKSWPGPPLPQTGFCPQNPSQEGPSLLTAQKSLPGRGWARGSIGHRGLRALTAPRGGVGVGGWRAGFQRAFLAGNKAGRQEGTSGGSRASEQSFLQTIREHSQDSSDPAPQPQVLASRPLQGQDREGSAQAPGGGLLPPGLRPRDSAGSMYWRWG